MVAKTRPGQHHKRHGKHQKHDKHFLRTYSPYLPLLLIVASLAVLLLPGRTDRPSDVLAYATQINAQSLLDESNRQRLDHGQTALSLNPQLSSAAQAKADDMARRDYWSHNTPEGQAPWIFIDNTGYTYKKAGENLAYGFNSSTDTITGWMNSPPHRDNLLDQAYRDAGFGLANAANYQQQGPATIVVALYGTPAAAAVASQTDGPGVKAFNTNSSGEPAGLSVARVQILTSGNTPWIVAALGIAATVGLIALLVKHSLALRRAFRRGERFVFKHPLLDVTIVAFVVLCGVVLQTQGFIL